MNKIIFDLGNTLIHQQVDDKETLDKMNLKLQDFALKTIIQLSENFELGLLTNTETSNKRQVADALKNLGILQYFNAIVTSVDVGFKKPNYLMFEAILKELETPKENVVMVGNDVYADILGAKKLGIRTVFYSIIQKDIENLESSNIKPDFRINNLNELIELSKLWK